MKHFNTKPNLRPFSQRSALAVVGLKLQAIHLFDPIVTGVHIPQKVVQYTPAQKLQDAFISMLAGSHGLVETNKRVRPDRALQRAFGRAACAEQSTISETINCATAQNVTELETAAKIIYQRFSRGYAHDYAVIRRGILCHMLSAKVDHRLSPKVCHSFSPKLCHLGA